MVAPLLTVVIPVRNRGGVRLENCLKGLRWQHDVKAEEVEIILSDFGSDPEYREQVEQAARRFQATVRYTPANGLWNRSRALNIGIKRARGKFTLCTDVDMVFAPNFLRALLDKQQELDGRGLLLCQYHDLGPETESRPIGEDDLEALRSSATMRPTYGMGGCQCAETAWFHRVRGFDQKYTFWGVEDNDLTVRAKHDGRIVDWVTERTFLLHQWHRTQKNDRPWLTKMNRWRLKLTGWIVRKNWLGWGE